MTLDGDQQVGEVAEHMRADRLALESADHGDVLVGRNAKVVGPEPHQAFDEADLGLGGGLIAGGGFVLENLLRQRRSRRRGAWSQVCSFAEKPFIKQSMSKRAVRLVR